MNPKRRLKIRIGTWLSVYTLTTLFLWYSGGWFVAVAFLSGIGIGFRLYPAIIKEIKEVKEVADEK